MASLTDRRSNPGSSIADSPAAGVVLPLGRGAKGLRGVVVRVGLPSYSHDPKVVSLAERSGGSSLDRDELERRLLEIGFVEGAEIEILHEGVIGRDPIGVRLDDMRVALRRREADAVLIQVEGEAGAFLQAAE